MLVHFPVIHGRHISMEWYVCVLGIPKCKFSKQMIKKILSYRIFIYNWGEIFILRTLKIRYMPVFCLLTLGRHIGTARFVVYCTCAKYRVVEYYRVCRFRDVILEWIVTNNVTSCTKCNLPHSIVQIC
jgi:hypothetical protein